MIDNPRGAIMIVGGGISGIQSALDLADSGFKVYLVERAPAIGGKMAQLDKTFPTNDCSMCIISPKLVEVGRHPNIELLTHSEVEAVTGEAGCFTVHLANYARYVDVLKCTGCGLCEMVCPVTHQSYFPQPEPAGGKKQAKNRSSKKAIITGTREPRPTSELKWRFQVADDRCSKCGLCHRACLHQAVTWQRQEIASINQDRCTGCGACYVACPDKFQAIVVADAPGAEQSLGVALHRRSQELKKLHGDDQGRCIRCGLCTMVCAKVMGPEALKLTAQGVEVKLDGCQVCGSCISLCPTGFLSIDTLTDQKPRPLLNEFNEGLNQRKPVNILYPQAVPRVPVISEESCVKLNTGFCGTCQTICGVGAIDYKQLGSSREIEVGSIILSPGIEVFEAKLRGEYGYGEYPNVVTSIEFERLLSASGPTSGTVARPADGRRPRKVAWLQCVGSRDASCNRDYCSSVCCMYATKEAFIAREHDADIEPTIFYIDMRSFGKNFDDYVERARENGVRYQRAMISRVFEDPVSTDLEVRYIDQQGARQSEIFDMVVLSVGIQVSEKTKRLAASLGVELDRFGFARTDGFSPLVTSRPGIFVSGACNGPKDIPETVSEASGAAQAASVSLATVRGSMLSEEQLPQEKIEEPGAELRIGVFVCHCGSNIASVVDVAAVEAYARTLPGVVYTDKPLYTCSQDSQEQMKNIIAEHRLNRVVVAACSPSTHEPLFMSTLRQTGLNKYYFDMANIRDHCSWVHSNEPEKATEKSRRLMRMAVANAAQAKPLTELEFDVESSLLVIGGGVAGMSAALEAAGQGFGVYLVEHQPRLGGQLRNLRKSLDNQDFGPFLENLERKVREHRQIKVFTNAAVIDQGGFVGSFETEIITPSGGSRTIKHGAILLATGATESRPEIYGLGDSERVMTQTDFEQLMVDDRRQVEGLRSVVMIQCAGSRCQEHLAYCSRVCCNSAVKNGLLLKERCPTARVDVLYRDMRCYGLAELDYRKARLAGINFIQYHPQTAAPAVTVTPDKVTVSILDPSINRYVEFSPEILVLSTGMVPADTEELASMLRVSRNEHGFFIEAHAKLRPVDLPSEGLFMAGTAHGPKSVSETIAQAQAAVARATTILSKKKLKLSGVYSTVAPEKCAVCLTCVRACPYGVPQITGEHTAYINPALCQGCGICVAECPAKTITMGRFEDKNLAAKLQSYDENAYANVNGEE